MAHFLAAVAVPILVWHLWTVVAWLADGPFQITEFRDPGSANWYAARVVELLSVTMGIAVLVYVLRSCRRAREILTFDVMFCLCGATNLWSDLGFNVLHPLLLVSSNFVNLNNTCGHMPFVVNPDCGRTPDAVLFWWPISAFGLLGAAVVAGALVSRARRRWPSITTVKLIALLFLGALALEVVFELPMVALGLWSYAPTPLSLPLGRGFRLPLIELFAAGVFFAALMAVRIFKDDRGKTLIERGLDGHSRRTAKTISLLALYGFFQLVSWIPGTMPLWPLGFFETRWPEYPAYLVNDVCDAPGVEGTTRYGPCPGSPGYRMPVRGSLPGRSP